MADTNFGALSTSQKRVWSAEVLKAGRDKSFWFANGFVSSNGTTPIHLVTELTNDGRGDKCVLPIVLDLKGDGVTGTQELTGREEAIQNDDTEIKLDLLRNAAKSKGEMAEQRTVIRFRVEARDTLGNWVAQMNDQLCTLTASGVAYTKNTDGSTRVGSNLPNLAFAADITAPSTNRKKFPNAVASTATLTATDKMSWDFLVRARAFAERKNLKPIKAKGKEYFCVVMTPEQMRDLKLDSNYINILKDGGVRGIENPLFTGAAAVVDGLIIHSSNKAYRTTGLASGSKYGAAGTIEGAQALLLGAQALGFAKIGSMKWVENANDDFGDKPAIGVKQMIGLVKPVFTSRVDNDTDEDFGVISMYSAAAA